MRAAAAAGTLATAMLGLLGSGVGVGVLAHGDHGEGTQKPMVAEDADWMTRHMAEEHHLSTFDASSFFALHDFDSDGRWERDEMLRTYGLFDESNSHIPSSRRDELSAQLLRLLDTDDSGDVSRDEFTTFIDKGNTLPDLGTGPGHHGDDEYEYEIHHWERYHDENTRLEDLVHPEDIAHFRKHELMEEEEERVERLNQMRIVEDNIPKKFRKG